MKQGRQFTSYSALYLVMFVYSEQAMMKSWGVTCTSSLLLAAQQARKRDRKSSARLQAATKTRRCPRAGQAARQWSSFFQAPLKAIGRGDFAPSSSWPRRFGVTKAKIILVIRTFPPNHGNQFSRLNQAPASVAEQN